MAVTHINNLEDLEAFAKRAASSSVLAIDTEFMREKTYFPMLCLLQMATDDEVVIVDPFAVTNLHCLKDLMRNESVVKLFHAGTQDLEIIYREVGALPWPLFDTQIAATLMGHTQQIGYANLVHAECGVALKKMDSFTDWTRRPLTDSQLSYAAEDVIYLPKLYRSMRKTLKEKGRLGWLDQDFKDLVDPTRYKINPRERFRRLKRASTLTRRQLSGAREMAAWRESRAIARDIPRKWVLTDEQIVEACKREARTVDELYMVRGMRERLPIRDARMVAALMGKGFDLPPEEWPLPSGKSKNEANVDLVLDLMTALVRLRARENNVALHTLASHDDLVSIARGHTENVEVLRGWRRTIVGEELLDLAAGRIELSIDGTSLVVRRVEG